MINKATLTDNHQHEQSSQSNVKLGKERLRSVKLTGVAITISIPLRNSRTCLCLGTPPYTTVFLISEEAPNLSHSSLIWTASSRVGASTSTIGPSPGFKYGCFKKQQSVRWVLPCSIFEHGSLPWMLLSLLPVREPSNSDTNALMSLKFFQQSHRYLRMSASNGKTATGTGTK